MKQTEKQPPKQTFLCFKEFGKKQKKQTKKPLILDFRL